jgi:hypothetical protein
VQKKVLSDSLGLVDFPIGLMVLSEVPALDGKTFEEIQITEVLEETNFLGASENDFWASL